MATRRHQRNIVRVRKLAASVKWQAEQADLTVEQDLLDLESYVSQLRDAVEETIASLT